MPSIRANFSLAACGIHCAVLRRQRRRRHGEDLLLKRHRPLVAGDRPIPKAPKQRLLDRHLFRLAGYGDPACEHLLERRVGIVERFGRPAGLPDWPGLNRFFCGGFM